VSHLSERASYLALRVCPRVDADVWWSAVRRRDDVPHVIAALLGGRARIELSRAEARHALAWAGTVEGWADSDTKPLFVYPTNLVGEFADSETA
jgi:hypothetical protein